MNRDALVGLLLASAAFIVTCSAPVATSSATPTQSAGSTVTTSPQLSSPAPTLSPSPSPTARPGITAHATQLPAEYRLMTLGHTEPSGQVHRLVALDLTGANRHVELATWQLPPRMPTTWGEAFSASSDGRRIALAGTGARGTGALYLLDTAAGTVKTLFDDASEHASAPVLSPDGTRIAFLRIPLVQNASSIVETGIFAGAVDDPASWRRIVDPQAPNSMAPLAWSPDGRWLAFVRLFIGGHVSLVRSDGSETVAVGRGTNVDWRSWEPRLLVSGPSNGGGGTGVWTFDVTSRELRRIASPATDMQNLTGAHWHPLLDRVLYIETVTQTPGALVAVWTRYADGRNGSRVSEASFLSGVDWSADGSRIDATIGGDDSVFGVTDLVTRRGVAKACRRGDVNAQICL